MGSETRRRAHPRARPGQWPSLGFSGEIPCRGPVAAADKSAFPPRTCLFDPLLSLAAAAISVVNESFAELLRCLSSFAVSRFAIATPGAAAVYIIVSCTKLPSLGGSLSPLHSVCLDSCRLTLSSFFSPLSFNAIVS